MDISGVSIPAVPEVRQEPPRDAQSQAAVRESAEGESTSSDSRSDSSNERRDNLSSLGNTVDERV